MTSIKQIEANRRNSLKSTGPKTDAGKQTSRCNAVRHGLTAETVIGALEDAEDYKAFEAAIIADYDAQSPVERELVLRLASLLWRLRRATTIETGLFEIQADHLSDFRKTRQISPASREIVYALFNPNSGPQAASHAVANVTEMSAVSRPTSIQDQVAPDVELARCFSGFAICPIMLSTASVAMKLRHSLIRAVGQVGNPPHFVDISPGEQRFRDEYRNLHRCFFAAIGRFLRPNGMIVPLENNCGSIAETFRGMVQGRGACIVFVCNCEGRRTPPGCPPHRTPWAMPLQRSVWKASGPPTLENCQKS